MVPGRRWYQYRCGLEAVLGGPAVTDKEQQVRWMLDICEKAVNRGDNQPGWPPDQGVDTSGSVLSRAGLIQIGQWRMQHEEAPHLRAEQGLQQRCLQTVRLLFEEAQAMLSDCPESEARSFIEAFWSSCSSSHFVWSDESLLKTLKWCAQALWNVVDDVKQRTLFLNGSDAWWLMWHVQKGCVEIQTGRYG